jgi:hypothetical protein
MAHARSDGNAQAQHCGSVPGSDSAHDYPMVKAFAWNAWRGQNIGESPVSVRKSPMFRKLRRLFVIKTRFEAFLIIYALALGAVERGSVYLTQYPGYGGKLLFLACTGAVFMAGAKILDCLKYEQAKQTAAAEQPAV